MKRKDLLNVKGVFRGRRVTQENNHPKNNSEKKTRPMANCWTFYPHALEMEKSLFMDIWKILHFNHFDMSKRQCKYFITPDSIEQSMPRQFCDEILAGVECKDKNIWNRIDNS